MRVRLTVIDAALWSLVGRPESAPSAPEAVGTVRCAHSQVGGMGSRCKSGADPPLCPGTSVTTVPLVGSEPTGKAWLIGPGARRPTSDRHAKSPRGKGWLYMKHRQFAALGGVVAALASALAITGPALGAGTGSGVTVRVEGLKHTLLQASVAHTEPGSITKGGTPKGSCPGTSGAGYLDSATHHNWKGTYSSGLGVEITSVLGETHTFSA